MPSSHPMRVPPLPEEEWSEDQRDLIVNGPGRGGISHVSRTLIRNPEIRRALMNWGNQVRDSRLPARDRELMILRTAWNTNSEYEWGQHAEIARTVGLGDAEIRDVAVGPDAGSWSVDDAVLLRAADELHHESTLGDSTWAALCARYDEQQVIEVTALVGSYHLLAFAVNSLGVQLEPGKSGFPTL